MKQYEPAQPPKWGIKALRFICHPDFREEIEGDLWEKYQVDLQKHGAKTARKQFYRQLLSIIRLNLIFHLNQNKMSPVLNVKESPYVLLLFTTMGLLLALALSPIADIDFQDKTMFSVPLDRMVWIIPLLLMSFWLLYLLTRKWLYSRMITWAHVLITVISTLLIVMVLYIGITPSQFTSDRHKLIGNAMQILSLIFVFGQLTYLANVILGLWGRYKEAG